MKFNQPAALINLKRRIRQVIGKDIIYLRQTQCETLSLGTSEEGWTVCPQNLNQDSIVYSCGIGKDISFDLTLIQKFRLHIYAFDPNPQTSNWLKHQNIPSQFYFNEYGIAGVNGKVPFYPPKNPTGIDYTLHSPHGKNHPTPLKVQVYTLPVIMQKLNHSYLDLLKMDIEGAEYAVLENILSTKIKVKQILVEFHHRFKNVGVNKTKKTIEMLNANGYKIFAVSLKGREYSFIKT